MPIWGGVHCNHCQISVGADALLAPLAPLLTAPLYDGWVVKKQWKMHNIICEWPLNSFHKTKWWSFLFHWDQPNMYRGSLQLVEIGGKRKQWAAKSVSFKAYVITKRGKTFSKVLLLFGFKLEYICLTLVITVISCSLLQWNITYSGSLWSKPNWVIAMYFHCSFTAKFSSVGFCELDFITFDSACLSLFQSKATFFLFASTKICFSPLFPWWKRFEIDIVIKKDNLLRLEKLICGGKHKSSISWLPTDFSCLSLDTTNWFSKFEEEMMARSDMVLNWCHVMVPQWGINYFNHLTWLLHC